jgi:PKD repeat protein
MRSCLFSVCTLVLFLPSVFAATVVTPTTTLGAETGKNTSAADSFPGTTNGNISSKANVSKVPTSKLLYTGSNTKIYAHFMPWFGFGNHVDIGYKSTDPAEVKAQVTDMLSRGITGMIIDWYGQGSNEDAAALVIKPEVESRNGQFEFAIMEDAGSRTLSGCSTTSPCTSALISDLKYIYSTYESSPAYMRWNGNPLVFFFGVEGLPIDWTSVRANVPGNPVFIFQNSGSFGRSYSGGGFSWVMPGDVTASDPMSLRYLDNFYSTALSYPAKVPFGAGYKGFDDSIADWTGHRFMDQQCGQTWVQTMAEIGKYYATANQLPAIQLVTWNDYEEGTEIETGIDNCLTVNAAVNGSIVSWSVTGQENTLDHYTVFISTDGQNLMPVGDYPVTTHTLDLSSYGFATGNYTVYVKAVGKPSIVNHMSPAVTYVSGTVQNQPPIARLTVTPTGGTVPLSVTADTSASTATSATITSSSINWGDGTSSTGPTASHSYPNVGSYTVTATVTDSNGLSGTATAPVTVSAAPIIPTVTVASPVNNATVSTQIHVVASGLAPNPIDALQIYLDGTFTYEVKSSQMDTVITAPPGAHAIAVKMWQTTGQTTLQIVNITAVDQPPVAMLNVTPLSGTGPLTVTASTSGSSDPDGTIASSSIDFGDGTVVNGTTASHTYSNAGTYTVKATVKDNYGLASTASATVTVTAAQITPKVTITSPVSNATTTSKVHMVASGVAPNPIDAMQIYLDSTLVYQVSASNIDTTLSVAPGTHAMTVKLWQAGQATSSAVNFTSVDQPPVAVLNVTPVFGTAPLTVTASTSGSSDPDGSIASSTIDFGDGTTATGSSASHTYANAGTYTVKATVTDNYGASSSTTATVTVSAITTTRTIVMTSPTPNSTVSGSLHVTGSASGPAGVSIMQIYIDGNLKYQVTASSVDSWLNLSIGKHRVTLKAWDSTGASWMTAARVTIQ